MNSESGESKPVIRILHQMARSGGTVICRCLASMDDIVLLSEIHPLGTRMYNPLDQADQWYRLLTEDDARRAATGRLTFVEAIELIEKRCRDTGKRLVLRDWSHLDYTGIPFTQPSFRPLLAEALEPRFRLLRFSTVRHPLDQWLSLSRKPVFRDRLGPARFLRGAMRFAGAAAGTGFIQYEDFTRRPDEILTRICERLDLPFDPAYRGKWQAYTNITGDVLPGRSGDRIAPLPRQDHDAAEAGQLTAIPAYRDVIRLLGYES